MSTLSLSPVMEAPRKERPAPRVLGRGLAHLLHQRDAGPGSVARPQPSRDQRDAGPSIVTEAPPTEPQPVATAPRRAPGLVAQVRMAFSPSYRLAMACGMLMGGVVAFFAFVIAHYETPDRPWLWILVAGAMLFSAKTVWQFGCRAFRDPWKATGFVLIVEGVLIFSVTPWLTWIALGYLISINAIATGTNLALEDEI